MAKDESTLTLAKARRLAVAYENANKDSRVLESGDTTELPQVGVNRFKSDRASFRPNQIRQTCKHCGRNNHLAVNCRFKNAECYACGTRGHTRNVCPKPQKMKSDRKSMHLVDNDSDISPDDIDCFEVYSLYRKKTENLWVTVSINGKDIKMEVDTGAALSILRATLFRKYFAQLPLLKTDVKFKTYSGEKMTPEGIAEVNVVYCDQKQKLKLYVVDTPGPSLFGREWMYAIKLNWKSLFSVHHLDNHTQFDNGASGKLNQMLSEFKDVFQDGIGKLQGPKAKLILKEGAQPKFLPARPVPYALRSKVESELQHLEEEGILTKVETSDWATPMVPVVKRNGKIRICGDFKVTVNPVLKIDHYPLLKIDDVFANLSGGQLFTKIDLRQAYLHMEVDDASKGYLTITTHKGLFRYNRLVFGIASAPAIWQRTMEQILQDIPGTCCILDDMIVTGRDISEHMDNLSLVLKRLQHHGLRVNREKTEFLRSTIEFCGFKINKDGKSVDIFYMSQLEHLPVTSQQVRRATMRDPILSQVLGFVTNGWNFVPQKNASYKDYLNRSNELTTCNNCLLWGNRVVIPSSLRSQVLAELHEGHLGIVKMKSLARTYFWWPGLDKDIEHLARQCPHCHDNRNIPEKAPCHWWQWPDSPWHRIHVDFAGPFLGSNFLVVVDAFSKWPEVIQMTSTTAERTISELRTLFAHNGIPHQLMSDNGPQFSCDLFKQFMANNGIKHVTSAPYHPATNGLAERFVQTFKRALRSMRAEKGSIEQKLNRFLMRYRNAPHCTTNDSPSLLFLNRRLRSRLDFAKTTLQTHVDNQQQRSVSGKLRSFAIGQSVLVRDYRANNKKWCKATVLKQTGLLSYHVMISPHKIWRRHVDQMLNDCESTSPSMNQSKPTSEIREPTNLSLNKSCFDFPLPVVNDFVGHNSPDVPPSHRTPRRYPTRIRTSRIPYSP